MNTDVTKCKEYAEAEAGGVTLPNTPFAPDDLTSAVGCNIDSSGYGLKPPVPDGEVGCLAAAATDTTAYHRVCCCLLPSEPIRRGY